MDTLFKFVLFFLFVSVPCNANNLKINGLVDKLLDTVAKSFKEAGTDMQAIDNMEEHFTALFMNGGLIASGGVFGNLSSVKRTGDATIDIKEDGASVVVSFGLGECNIYFKSCNAWLGYLSLTEELYATVDKNSLEAKISLNISGDDCITTLDDMHLTQLSGWEVDIKGLSIISYIVDNIVDWIIYWYEDYIKDTLESQLKSSIADELMNVDFCSLIS